MYHIFFIHSSIDRHLGCFHVLTIVNSVAVNIGVYVSFWIMVFSRAQKCCRKGDHFQGPRVGSCLTVGNELSEQTHMLTKQKTLLGRGPLGREQQRKGTEENCSAVWLTVSGFMVMGLVSGLSLANRLAWPIFGLTFGPFWRCAHLSAKVDSSAKDSGRLVGQNYGLVSPPSFWPLLNSPG